MERHDGILVSFLGDLERSAKAGVPVYQLAGGAGFLWAATFRNDGKGVLRFLAIDDSQITLPSQVATNNAECAPATPGPGFQASGGKYVITREIFDLSTDVEGAIKASLGDNAVIADWQTLKKVLSTKPQLANFINQVGIPTQTANGPCKNFLVSNGGRLRLGDGFWLFLARHDGRVPENWAVLDSIDNHSLDLGRWSYRSQALALIRDKSPEASTSTRAHADPKVAAAEAAKEAAEAEARRKAAEAEAEAQHKAAVADEAEGEREVAEAEAAKQAAKAEAQQKAAEAELQVNAKRDPNDVVAQVLNYTVFGNDEGSGDSYWFKDPAGKCLYRLHIAVRRSQKDAASDFLLNFGIGNALMQRRVIDLDELDPKNITFRYDTNQTLWGENGAGTIIQHVSEILFFYVGTLDLNRLQRGWSLIYSKYCRGRDKPF